MPLRSLLSVSSLAALLLAPLPAAAHDQAPSDVARRLADPGNQIAATVALTAMVEALLDVKVEPLRRALSSVGDDRADDLPRDARLRDLAGPGARELPAEIGRRVPQTMGAASGMVGALEDMLPELRAAAGRMQDAMPRQ